MEYKELDQASESWINHTQTPGIESNETIPLSDLTAVNDATYEFENLRQNEFLRSRESDFIIIRALKKLWYGPEEAVDESPKFPFKWKLLQSIEEFPYTKFKSFFPSFKWRLVLLSLHLLIWLSLLHAILYPYLFKKPVFKPANGVKQESIISLSCNSFLHWEGTNNACGLNAENCLLKNKEYIIRCPALCDQGGYLYSAVSVGDKKVKYVGYQIGGGKLEEIGINGELSYPYRADSFPCSAGVHSGLISPVFGGCARVSMDGPQNYFNPQLGYYKTGMSILFGSFFPGSFTFKEIGEGIASGCYDPRFLVLIINILFSLPVFYLYEGIIGYWVLNITGYWTILLATDPPMLVDPNIFYTPFELISIGFRRLLPLCFVLYVLWKCSVKRTLEDGSPTSKILLWFPTFWLGVLNNVTFDRLPVDRLTAKDLKEQAGALTAVLSIISTIVVCAIIQAYSIWKSGRFQKYFKIYITLIVSVVFLASIPGLNLRVHHYILGMLLVPGCATRGVSAYLFQGILLGLVLSGVSRWDFASIVETDFALLRGEAGAALKPPIFQFDSSHNHTISWTMDYPNATIDETGIIDGVSLLINDVESYVGYNQTIDLDKIISSNENLQNMIENSITFMNGTTELYLRLAQCSVKNPIAYRGDYTNAGKFEWPQGVWHEPQPGVS